MKKIFLAVSGLIILTLFILVTVNAQGTDAIASKGKIEISISDKACCNVAGNKMTNCCSGQANCDASKCKEGKCDLATCKNCKCDALCSGKCGQVSCMSKSGKSCAGVMAGPMNCAKDMPIAAK